jgi:hypothetical protein
MAYGLLKRRGAGRRKLEITGCGGALGDRAEILAQFE